MSLSFLINNGASLMHRADDNWTPLHRAARGAHVDTVVLLLEHGANLLAKDAKGNIPLHHAARSGSLETCVQVLEYDPSLKERQLVFWDKRGATARNVAFYCAHYGVSKYLREAEHIVRGTLPSTANKLALAIEGGDVQRVGALLDREPTALEAPDQDGQPPLHIAVQEFQFDVVKLLLSRGAAIDAVGYHGWRALHIAASLGNLQIVDICLAYNADIHARTHTLQTALHKAASSGSLHVIQRLINAGAELEARNDRGMTCLHVAAHKNDEAIVRALVLEHNINVLLRDRHGEYASKWSERGAGLSVSGWLKVEEKKAKARLGSASAQRSLTPADQLALNVPEKTVSRRVSSQNIETIEALVQEEDGFAL